LPLMLLLRNRGGAKPVIATLALGYLAFVIWVGGDLMFARFCLPITPLCYLGLEALTRRYVRGRARWLVLVLVAAGTVLFHRHDDLYVEGQAVHGVADERAQYPEHRTARIRATGRRLGELLRGTDARLAFSGTQAMLIYESKVPYALEAVTGLTDHYLAHQEVGERGHVGHEKGAFRTPASTEYVLRTQGVHLLLFDRPEWTVPFPWMHVGFDGQDFTLVRWDRTVMARLLGQPGIVATDLERHLDDYIAMLEREPAAKTKAQVEIELMAFDRVYFRWHDDAARRDRIAAWLRR
ncbi:MAG: hypothetical protein KDC98_19795, partial [Planctomycetes bacterium]|nr:hypothetical protein [Planctomycetota bacterium]